MQQVAYDVLVDVYWIGATLCCVLLVLCVGHQQCHAVINALLYYGKLKHSSPATGVLADTTAVVYSQHRLVLVLHLIHTARRLYESVAISVSNPQSTMHIAHYILGVTYYLFVPLSILLSSSSYPPLFPIAATLFYITGSLIQHHSLRILAAIRMEHNSVIGIPRGGLFELVSCPHYLGEILVYTGLLGLSSQWYSAMLYCWVFTVLNQTTSGLQCHHWYRKHFPQYPKTRKAIFPALL